MKVEKLDNYGRGIIYLNNKICFVDNALPTEDVEIEITNSKKKYQEAFSTKIKNKSKIRTLPRCNYYNVCGGCHLMHMKEDMQNQFKTDKITDIMQKFLHKKLNIILIKTDKFYNYRNKVVLHVKNNKLGFYKDKSNELVEIDSCLLVHSKINELISFLKEYIKKETNINKLTIKLGNNTNEIMLIINGKVNNYFSLINKVKVLIINNKVISNNNYIISMIGNKKYAISKNSFFQVNSNITKLLYDEILKNIKRLKAKDVLDLYCGSGTIGLYICDYVNSVLGIEVVEDAIKDATNNKKLNNAKNINFIKGKVEDKINTINSQYDTVIVDPPRSGLHKKVIEVIINKNFKNIIYISCNPITLARDVELLINKYKVEFIKAFDMFPNTYHIESVCLLSQKD